MENRTGRNTASDDPAELSTEADGDRPLSHAEAEAAGIVPGMVVYGDSSLDPNADDRRDLNAPDDDAHL